MVDCHSSLNSSSPKLDSSEADEEFEVATQTRVILFSILRHGREWRIAYYISSYRYSLPNSGSGTASFTIVHAGDTISNSQERNYFS